MSNLQESSQRIQRQPNCTPKYKLVIRHPFIACCPAALPKRPRFDEGVHPWHKGVIEIAGGSLYRPKMYTKKFHVKNLCTPKIYILKSSVFSNDFRAESQSWNLWTKPSSLQCFDTNGMVARAKQIPKNPNGWDPSNPSPLGKSLR